MSSLLCTQVVMLADIPHVYPNPQTHDGTQMSGQSSHMLMPAMTAITSQLSRIGQMAAALVAEQCYQEGVCAGDIPMQPPKTLDELESMMENALLQCSTLSQQHQDVASQLANTKLELANLQGGVGGGVCVSHR